MNVKEIIHILKNSSKDEVQLIERAFEFAKDAHKEQKIRLGKCQYPFFRHIVR